MITVEDRPRQAASGVASRGQRVDDQVGAHVLGDRPPGQPSGVTVDHGGQVEVRPVGDREVGDVADVALVGLFGGEVAAQQVGHGLLGRVGHGGAHPAAQPQPGDLFLTMMRATRLWFTRAVGSAPSLSSAVIRGTP
jgi:hypothetical protein